MTKVAKIWKCEVCGITMVFRIAIARKTCTNCHSPDPTTIGAIGEIDTP